MHQKDPAGNGRVFFLTAGFYAAGERRARQHFATMPSFENSDKLLVQ
jgi:hypothetical protein